MPEELTPLDWASYWAGAVVRWPHLPECTMQDIERCLRRFDANVAAMAPEEQQRAFVLRDAIERAARWAVLGESLGGRRHAA